MDQINTQGLTSSQQGFQTEQSGSKFDSVKQTVADKLKDAASALHEKLGQGDGQNETLSNYGQQAETLLNRSSDYIRDLDLNQINTDIRNEIRRNPGRSLLIAGAAGLLLGVLFRR